MLHTSINMYVLSVRLWIAFAVGSYKARFLTKNQQTQIKVHGMIVSQKLPTKFDFQSEFSTSRII